MFAPDYLRFYRSSTRRAARNAVRRSPQRRHLPIELLENRCLLSGIAPGAAIQLADMNAAGTDSANTGATFPSISDDGRYETYESISTNLIPGKTITGAVNIYLRDRETNTTTLLSKNLAGTNGGNNNSYYPIISGNGQEVVFVSAATNLVSNDNNGNNPEQIQNVMAINLLTHKITLVSVSTSGGPGNGESRNASISDDGRYVVFESDASNLVPHDTNGATDVFVRDLVMNTTTLISINAKGTASGNGTSNDPVISADGNVVAFDSLANNLDPKVTDIAPYENYQVYARNLTTKTTILVSVNHSQPTHAANDESIFPSLSADGSEIAFQSRATNLTSIPDGNSEAAPDVYARKLSPLVATQLVSINLKGTASGDAGAFNPIVSGNGNFVVFSSFANNLTNNDHGGTGTADKNIYERNLATKTTVLVSVDAAGTNIGNNISELPNQTFANSQQQSTGIVSSNGQYVIFMSRATNMVSGFVDKQTNNPQGAFDLYLRDTMANTTTLVSHQVNTTKTGGNQVSGTAAITPSGTYIAFESTASNLVSHDTNGGVNQTDVFATPKFTSSGTTSGSVQAGKFVISPDQMDAGPTDQQLEARSVSTDEFFNKAGGTNADRVDAIDLLFGRAADAGGVSFWNSALTATLRTRISNEVVVNVGG